MQLFFRQFPRRRLLSSHLIQVVLIWLLMFVSMRFALSQTVVIEPASGSSVIRSYELLGQGRLESKEVKDITTFVPGGRTEFVLDMSLIDGGSQKIQGNLDILNTKGEQTGASTFHFESPQPQSRMVRGIKKILASDHILRITNGTDVAVNYWLYMKPANSVTPPPLFGSKSLSSLGSIAEWGFI